jgi:hypothetical protein
LPIYGRLCQILIVNPPVRCFKGSPGNRRACDDEGLCWCERLSCSGFEPGSPGSGTRVALLYYRSQSLAILLEQEKGIHEQRLIYAADVSLHTLHEARAGTSLWCDSGSTTASRRDVHAALGIVHGRWRPRRPPVSRSSRGTIWPLVAVRAIRRYPAPQPFDRIQRRAPR